MAYLPARTSLDLARSYGVDRAAGTAGIGRRGACDQIGERRLLADFACKTDRQLHDEVPSANPLAGDTNPIAGSYSPFVLKLSREDGSQRISSLETTLPAGLVGRDDELANASLRFSLGRRTTEAEIDAAALRICAQVRKLREISALWD